MQGTAVPSHAHAPAVATPAVTCRGVTKRFGEIFAVHDVTLTVGRGEILALLGPSGCGKTTFLRLVAGFERPDAGELVLGDEIVAGSGRFVPPEHRRVGVVFQDYALFPHLSVRGNVSFGLRGRERENRVHEVLDLVGLTGVADRMPAELSGGQQQRVALARALAPEPDIVLLDEPFSNLDAALRERVRAEVRDILLEAGATTIFVTHDQEEALSLADRVAIMRAGELHQIDTPELVYTRPSDPFVASFVGGANLVVGEGADGAVSSPLGTIRPLNPAPDGPTLLVVRPESVRLRPDPEGDGVVRGAVFYGHDQLVEIDVGSAILLRCRLGPGRFFEAGDRVSVTVVGDEILAFPAPD